MARALVIGASGGIGAAITAALRARGDDVVTLSRRADGLDVTDAASIARHLGALERPFDLILVATGALEIDDSVPEKALRHLTPDGMLAQFRLNAMGPALVMAQAPRLLPREGRSVLAVLSARVGSIGDNGFGGWYSYRAAKAALNQFLRTAAVEIGRSHKHAICVALHPGTVATAFTEKYLGRHPAVTPEHAADRLVALIDGLGPEHSGGFYDYSGAVVPW
jgi:NAD(P)-dependent dehydrogenase (short-subunit alcohol dehydrogenase family)